MKFILKIFIILFKSFIIFHDWFLPKCICLAICPFLLCHQICFTFFIKIHNNLFYPCLGYSSLITETKYLTPVRDFWCNRQQKEKRKWRWNFFKVLERSPAHMVAWLSPPTGYRGAEGCRIFDWKWCMGRALMRCEEHIGIFCMCKWEGKLQFWPKEKKQEVAIRLSVLALAFPMLDNYHNYTVIYTKERNLHSCLCIVRKRMKV